MSIKTNLHVNNKHSHGYNFSSLVKAHPPLAAFIIENKHNQQATIDFSNPQAVKALNTSLLKKHYRLKYWDFPPNYLCPAIPGRVDYIHYLADLLKNTTTLSHNTESKKVSVLDIGTGASCIYPLLGASEYQWHFIASDIDPLSVKAATVNVQANKSVSSLISCRLQTNSKHIFNGIIQANEFYHLTLCNPPFHKSLAEATRGSQRKWQNLQKKDGLTKQVTPKKTLNFGGQKAELWCDGGELAFIRQMIKESKHYREQVLWFTCLVSKKEHLSKLKLSLKKANVAQLKVINMAQGQKNSRFIAWRFSSIL